MARELLVTSLREVRLCATPARIATLAALKASRRPLSHADIVRRLARDDFDRATVFRNLATLTRAGLVRRLDAGDRVWRFVASGKSSSPWSATFDCIRCGGIRPLREVHLHVAMAMAMAMATAPSVITRREVEIEVRGH